MKIILDTKSFAEAVDWATKKFDAKNDKSYVALAVDKSGTGSVSHNNSTSYMKSDFQVLEVEMNDDETRIAMDGAFLKKLASVLSGVGASSEIDLDEKDDFLTLKTMNGRFTIPLLDVRVPEEPAVLELGEVDDREYFDSLQRLSKLCEHNAGLMPVLGAVDIKLDNDDQKIVMMATDRYALGEITIDFDPSENTENFVSEHENILLPVEDAVLISPSKGLTSSVTLVYNESGGKFGYLFADSRMALFSLQDGQPLSYETLKKKATNNVSQSMTVDVREFKKAIKSVSDLAWLEEHIVFDVSENGLVITDLNKQNKMSVEVEDLSIDQSHSIKFVRSIINEAFSPIATEKMQIKWSEADKPFTLEPLLDDGKVLDSVFVFVVPTK